jgi:hypothetical protein
MVMMRGRSWSIMRGVNAFCTSARRRVRRIGHEHRSGDPARVDRLDGAFGREPRVGQAEDDIGVARQRPRLEHVVPLHRRRGVQVAVQRVGVLAKLRQQRVVGLHIGQHAGFH